jgi:hypothetical protein
MGRETLNEPLQARWQYRAQKLGQNLAEGSRLVYWRSSNRRVKTEIPVKMYGMKLRGILSSIIDSRCLTLFPIKRFEQGAPVVFMHVPKTSGTAVTNSFVEALTPRLAVYGLDRSLFGGFRAFDTVQADLRGTIFLDPAKVPPEANFVSGHMSFTTLAQAYKKAQYVTVLREPISRLISHWLYWRTQSDETMLPWGEWAQRVYVARQPLAAFLSYDEIACQTDNVTVRMLLWPHPLIPNRGFIDKTADKILIEQALMRLRRFAFADVIENPAFRANLESWLGRSMTNHRVNETPAIPSALKSALHNELTTNALDLVEARSRLDRELWTALARQRLSHLNVESLRERTIMANIARHSWLMIGQAISVTSVTQAGSTIAVNGTGFSTLTVINFFNAQGGGVVNLGGLTAGGAAKIPLTIVNSNQFTFTKPARSVPGLAYVQALNPPSLTSSGTGPGGSFTLK